jgi:hypothetical protein
MSSSEQLYTEMSSQLEQFHILLHRRRRANWVWIIVAMILAKSVQLSAVANHIADATDAVARIANVRRWLKNPRIDTQTRAQRSAPIAMVGAQAGYSMQEPQRSGLGLRTRAVWVAPGDGGGAGGVVGSGARVGVMPPRRDATWIVRRETGSDQRHRTGLELGRGRWRPTDCLLQTDVSIACQVAGSP